MSISHSLEFESNNSKEEILKFILSCHVGFTESNNGFETEGIYGNIWELGKDNQEVTYETYGFHPTLYLSFYEESGVEYATGYETMGRAIALILGEEKGDAMFFYVVDTPILRRTKGQIKVADDEHFDWLRNALSEFNLEYETTSKEVIRLE
jgi:hypothetical protein